MDLLHVSICFHVKELCFNTWGRITIESGKIMMRYDIWYFVPAPWYTYPPLFSSKDTANVVQSRPRKVADVKMDIGLPKNGGYS